jgi:type I restriction enzyme S subunit
MKTRTVQLSDVATVLNGKTPSKVEQRRVGFPVLKIRDVNEFGQFTGPFTSFVEPDLVAGLAGKLICDGDTLVLNAAHNADYVASKSFFASGSVAGALATGEWLIIRPDLNETDARFLYFWSQSVKSRSRIRDLVKGIHLYPKDVADISLALPDLSEQRRIAERLEQADRLVRTRRYALELTDTFLPAAFLELFGNPVANPRGWERARICELGDVETGNTPPRETADYYGSVIEWIKSDNISLARMHPSNATEGLSEKGIEVGRIVETGSLLLTCIAGSETSIGNVVLTDRRVAFNQQINAVTPHRDVDPQFLYGLFLAAKPMIQRNTTLAMKRMITKGKLEKLVLIKPPLTLQQKFAAVVERVERLRAVQREALRQAEHLFASLLHRAFSG